MIPAEIGCWMPIGTGLSQARLAVCAATRWLVKHLEIFLANGTVLAPLSTRHGGRTRRGRQRVVKQQRTRVVSGASEGEAGLPQAREEFSVELLRRLRLLDREIQALDSEEIHVSFVETARTLRECRQALIDTLQASVEGENWSLERRKIIGRWKQYRRRFESLAAAWQRRYSARPGQWRRGPRW